MQSSTSIYRCQDDDPPDISIFSIRLQTGPFIITWSEASRTTIAQRMVRIHRRAGQRQRARTPDAYPSTGVLELQVNVITVDERMPTNAIFLYFLPFHHNPTNRGTRTAPKVPARMEWANGPWARILLSRTASEAYCATRAPPKIA